METTVVCGIGNPYVSDDGIGVFVVRELGRRITDDRVVCTELTTGAFDILTAIAGYREAVLVDVARTGTDPPGCIKILSPLASPSRSQPISLHSITFETALQQGSLLGLAMPRCLTVFTVEGKDTETFHEGCTDEVQAALPAIVDRIFSFVKSKTPNLCCAPCNDEPAVSACCSRSQQ